MPITNLPARQDTQCATADFVFGDLGASASYQAAITLPLNAVVVSGAVTMTVALNSATSDTISIGDKVGSASATATRYAAAASSAATGRTVLLIPTGIKAAAETTVGLVWTGVGTAPSAGTGRLVIEYIIDGAADSTYDA